MAEKIGDDMITHGINIKRPAIPTKVWDTICSFYFFIFFLFVLVRKLGGSLHLMVALITYSYCLTINIFYRNLKWNAWLSMIVFVVLVIDHADNINDFSHIKEIRLICRVMTLNHYWAMVSLFYLAPHFHHTQGKSLLHVSVF